MTKLELIEKWVPNYMEYIDKLGIEVAYESAKERLLSSELKDYPNAESNRKYLDKWIPNWLDLAEMIGVEETLKEAKRIEGEKVYYELDSVMAEPAEEDDESLIERIGRDFFNQGFEDYEIYSTLKEQFGKKMAIDYIDRHYKEECQAYRFEREQEWAANQPVLIVKEEEDSDDLPF